MILTVSPHAMWGLKATLENEEKLNESTEYTIILDNKTQPVVKNPNKCHEFITSSIQTWIKTNKLNIYESHNPPKFSAKIDANNIIITGRLK